MTPRQMRVLKAIDSGDRVYFSHIAGRYYHLKRGEHVPELVRLGTVNSLVKRGLVTLAASKVQLTEAGESFLKSEPPL